MSNGPAGPPEPPRRPPEDEWERDDRDWTNYVECALDPRGAAGEMARSYAECRLLREAFTASDDQVAALRARLDAAQSHVDDLHEHRGLSETAALRITHALNGKKGPVQR